MSQKSFNIRVYGLVIKNNQVLVSDESRHGLTFTKFPGGGLEWGEGLKDALVREFDEELGVQLTAMEQFYITDFFVESAFNANDQVISVYFKARLAKQEIDLNGKGEENFRWVPIKDLHPNQFKFPIDKLVASKLNP